MNFRKLLNYLRCSYLFSPLNCVCRHFLKLPVCDMILLATDASSDGEGDSSTHYEVIYEAINEMTPSKEEIFGPARDARGDSEDSFDSEDSDDAYCRLEPHVGAGIKYLSLGAVKIMILV